MAQHGPGIDDSFEDLPIAKWLNQKPNETHFHEDEMMSIASDLNARSTSTTISVVSTTTDDTMEYEHIRREIENLSNALDFWAMKRMNACFSRWHEHTSTKLNVLHIKYKNYVHFRDKKRLYQCFKKWQILQLNYRSAVISLSHWVFNLQSSAFTEWKSMFILSCC